MKRIVFVPLLLAVSLLAGCATAPRSSAPNPNVRVDWSDPVNFTDTRSNLCRNRAKPEEWLSQLTRYVENRADRVFFLGDAVLAHQRCHVAERLVCLVLALQQPR